MLNLAREIRRTAKVGIITDNKSDRMNVVRNIQKLDDIFDPIIVSAEIGCTKADTLIFDEALTRARVKACECIFIDNNVFNVQTAKEFGMNTIHFDDGQNDVASLRDLLNSQYGLSLSTN